MISPETPTNRTNYHSFRVGDWNVEPAAGQISRGGTRVKLEPKVMEVLIYLASRQGDLVTRDDLERDVWKGAIVGYDSITSPIIKLRKALTDDARKPRYITTVPKRGYRLIAAVQDSITGDEEARTNEAEGSASVGNSSRATLWKLLVAAVFLVFVLVTGLLFYQDKQTPLASIVVIPFENLSSGPTEEYFADGMTDDIITDLSRLSNLLVFSSSTSFTYKGRKVPPQTIGTELDVDYVLDGSIRRNGDEIRVNAQLIDTKTGIQKWASRYDRRVAEVFAVQDEVTSGIVKALTVQLTNQEKKRLVYRNTDNLKAYELFQEGQRLSRIGSKETNEQAQATYRQVIRIDPNYGRAYGALAYNLAYSYRLGWTDSPIATLDRALELAKQAIKLDDSIPQTYWSLGYVYLMRKEYANAENAVAQAVSIAPNYADGYGLLALISNNLGEPERAIEFVTKGMRLNPYYTWDYPYNLGRAYYTLGRYDDAIESLTNALERNENAVPVRLFLAASYVHADRHDDAEWEIEQIMVLTPEATISHTKNTIPFQKPDLMKSFLADLRKAGLPE
jgi:TolB-like protein/DNA-binding winged helix-turn-helix (wHTH) protein/Tfp pilus assembly protein PilF